MADKTETSRSPSEEAPAPSTDNTSINIAVATVENPAGPFKFVLTYLSGLLAKYQAALGVNPLRTKAITSCIISVIGELIGSYIKYRKRIGDNVAARAVGGRAVPLPNILNWPRIGIFGVYGLAITGMCRGLNCCMLRGVLLYRVIFIFHI